MNSQKMSTILIVDDIPENVAALFHLLSLHHFELLVARNGEMALELVEYEHPDLILLDIMMPGLDGFETCRRLKSIPEAQSIPIIFMTAISDTISKIEGFNLGAVDYITKPFQQEEVLARINTHLTICQLQKQMQLKNLELEVRNQELDAFSRTVAHDLKNPITDLISLTELVLEEYAPNLVPPGQQCLQQILKTGENILSIISALLLLAQISKQQVKPEPVDMQEVIIQVKQRLSYLLRRYRGEVVYPSRWPKIQGYAPWIEEVWMNYLSNGLKYGGNPPHLELGYVELADNTVQFWVQDNGQGLAKGKQKQLFTPFTRLENQHFREGHGLGLSIVQTIIEKLGGKAGVNSAEGQGSVFYFILPKA